MFTWKVSLEILSCCSFKQFIPLFTDMHESDNGCKLPLERTAAVLSEEALLATTQLSICIRDAVER